MAIGKFHHLFIGADNERFWQDFDLSAAALLRSFAAVLLYVPCIFLIIYWSGVSLAHSAHSLLSIAALTLVIAFSFSVLARIFCQLFQRQAAWPAWVILRHWSILTILVLIAAVFGAAHIGVLPDFAAFGLSMGLYLLTLAIDIRLAQRVAGFSWMEAIFIGALISFASMLILAAGIAQFSG